MPTILVLGGGGFYGKYLVEDILAFTDARVLVASRQPEPHTSDRVSTAMCDRRDLARLIALSEECEILVNLAGPFQDAPLEPLLAACAAGAHYIDVSEDRAMARRVRAMDQDVRDAGIAAFSGLSVVPGMEALFARLLEPCFDRLTGFRGFAAPDTKRHRGRAMFWTMMYGVGRPFTLPRDGIPRRVRGWSEGEWVRFPPPLGRRLVHLVLEMADADVLPELLGVGTVEFKAGSEWPFLNRLLAFASATRARFGGPAWEDFTTLARALSWTFGRFGKNEGGVVFEATGLVGGSEKRHRVAVVGESEGGRIPIALAGIAVEEILAHRVPDAGLVNLATWIPSDVLLDRIQARGLAVWGLPDGGRQWRPFTLPDRAFWR
jgi:hypothetical protein